VQLPQDTAQDLLVVAPRLAAPAVGGQQRLHAGEGLVAELEHRACSWAGCFQEATLPSCTAVSSQVRL
jgi:hypothetical protein